MSQVFASPSYRGNRIGVWLVVVAVAVLEPTAGFVRPAGAQGAARQRQTIRRATAPAKWDAAVEAQFAPDAFAILEGPRPDLGGSRAVVRSADQNASGDSSRSGAAPPEQSADGFKWSGLISEATLTDEIKEAKGRLTAACGKPGDFKGGGYEKARRGFSAVALCFGVIAAYDQDIRWRRDAVTARDLFARAGFNCKVGTDQTFTEAKSRLDDLQSLLDGNAPEGKAEKDDDFQWSKVAARPALMSRLEEAEEVIRPAIADKSAFGSQLEQFVHAVEMVAAIGEVIIKPDFEYHDDDSYVGYAVEMRDAAVSARAAAEQKDYEAARAAIGRLQKSCSACHGDYRS
jgi:hypothetical protein